MLKQHHLRHGWHQGKLGRHQFVHPMKHGKHDKRLLSVLNALSQLALYDDEFDRVACGSGTWHDVFRSSKLEIQFD